MSMTLEQIRGLAVKSKIPRVEGTLQAVYETKSGHGSKGPWRIQNVILAQADDSMKATIFNGPNVDKSMEGEEVAIMCSQVKNGLSGVEAEDNEWPKNSGEITRQIRMDRTARIMLLGDAPTDAAGNPPVAAAVNANKMPVKSAKPKAVETFVDTTDRMANAYDIARLKIEELKAERKEVYTITDDQVQALAAMMVITGDKKGSINSVPTTPLYLIGGNVVRDEPVAKKADDF